MRILGATWVYSTGMSSAIEVHTIWVRHAAMPTSCQYQSNMGPNTYTGTMVKTKNQCLTSTQFGGQKLESPVPISISKNQTRIKSDFWNGCRIRINFIFNFFEEPDPKTNSQFHLCVKPELKLKSELELEPIFFSFF